jgi:carboxylesterase
MTQQPATAHHPASPHAHPLGVLLLHGFTSSLDTVNGLVPHLERAGLPYEMPTLHGHGTAPADLVGATWHRWYEDTERALDHLLERCERAVVVGFSMGGVAALHLAVQRPERLAGVVAIAPALQLNITGRWLLPFLGRLHHQAKVDARRAFEDAALAATSTNYRTAPISAVYSLAQFGKVVERELPRLQIPLLVLYTPRDRVVLPEGARLTYERAGTPPDQKAIRAFERSGHEMLMDGQRDEVFAAIIDFIAARRG